ncbi:Shedu immune nuclease family protein [Halobacillus sp. Nhm2S1]|uniref:Shedu immune nuclease family protein n=1 Tax=Halobacillus sp. Nhm2S1 TaxID=2866716 RepID=UPI001C73820E|nr:Shedu immune nuclease family protein [Halobacillus sp. Nhm2S1]MBX0357712.1 DUF4263 domain-containing protein [Halobacillus sp. Nhm2S1]
MAYEFIYIEENNCWELSRQQSSKYRSQYDTVLDRNIFKLPIEALDLISIGDIPKKTRIYLDNSATVHGFQTVYPFDDFYFEVNEKNFNIVFRCFRGYHHHMDSRYNLNRYFEDLLSFSEESPDIEVVPKGENEDGGSYYGLANIRFTEGTLDTATENAISKLCGIIDDFEKEISGLRGFRYLLNIWDKHKGKNESEEFWQQKFSDNPWVLAQLFAVPITYFNEKFYAGGKNIDNEGGVFPDFLFKEQYTANVALVEIKTPNSKLVDDKRYRNGAHGMAEELNGGVVQLLKQRDILLKDVKSVRKPSSDPNKYYDPINPMCYLIIGSNKQFGTDLSDEKRESFNLFRNELRSIEVLTFDEVFKRIETVLEISMNVSKS